MRPRGAIGRLDAKRTIMANTPSAKKATRKIEARTAVNKARRSRVRTFIRKVEEAITAGDHKQAMEAPAHRPRALFMPIWPLARSAA